MEDSSAEKEPRLEHLSLARRWLVHEERFRANLYDGQEPPGTVLQIASRDWPRLVLTAVHAVNHTRNAKTKYADRGTGGLVLLLAEVLGCAAVVVAGADSGDGNVDLKHPAKEMVSKLSPRPTFLVDIHGMQDRGIDLEMGTGLSDLVPPHMFKAFTSDELRLTTAVDEMFNAGGEGTMTRWAQSCGIRACQIEISARLRPPVNDEMALNSVTEALIGLLLPMKDAEH
jgi:hypothetical protein